MKQSPNAPTAELELLLRCSVIKGQLESLAASAHPEAAAILEYAARILRLLTPALNDNARIEVA